MLEINILKDSNYLWVDIEGKLIIEEDGKNMFEQISSNISEKCSNIVLNFRMSNFYFLGGPTKTCKRSTKNQQTHEK